MTIFMIWNTFEIQIVGISGSYVCFELLKLISDSNLYLGFNDTIMLWLKCSLTKILDTYKQNSKSRKLFVPWIWSFLKPQHPQCYLSIALVVILVTFQYIMSCSWGFHVQQPCSDLGICHCTLTVEIMHIHTVEGGGKGWGRALRYIGIHMRK